MTERDIVERLGGSSKFYSSRPVKRFDLTETDMGPNEADGVSALLLEAAAEITRLREMVTWRPIETAPKDGTEILVNTNAYECGCVIAKWFKYNGREAFRDWDADAHTPTHWLPLPPPPKETP